LHRGVGRRALRGPLHAFGTRVTVLGNLQGDAELLRILRDAPLRLKIADDCLEGRAVGRERDRLRSLARQRTDQILGGLRR
jgi:hypothetical protein